MLIKVALVNKLVVYHKKGKSMENNIKKLVCGCMVGSMLLTIPLAGNAYFCKTAQATSIQKTVNLLQKNTNEEIIKTLNVKANNLVLMDANSGTVLLSRNSDTPLPMASMTKMMTLLIVMEEAERGVIDINKNTRISEYSASQEGSECFLDANKEYNITELIKSVAVASANDSAVALAELVSGSEEVFARKMNERAKELGLKNTHFVNATGLDVDGHYSTCEDLAILIKELNKYDLVKRLSKTWMYDMVHSDNRVTNLTNTNRLVRTNPEIVLAKTGHTDNAGFCISALGEKNGLSLVAVVMGEKTSADRFGDVVKLLNYGFANYTSVKVIDKNTQIKEIDVVGGKQNKVLVYPETDLYYLAKKDEVIIKDISEIIEPKINAPITKDSALGELKVRINDSEFSVKLVSREDVEKKTYIDYVKELM